MTFARADLINHLDTLGIKTTTVEHPAVYTVEQAKRLRGNLTGGHCKNLFLKDKKGMLWLLVALEDKKIDIKALRKIIGSSQLSFARSDLLIETLGVTPGSVTPFGVINDRQNRVTVILDEDLMEYDILNFHPMTYKATTRISPRGLMEFFRTTRHKPIFVEL